MKFASHPRPVLCLEVFASAMAPMNTKTGPKKKRTRTSRIGAAAQPASTLSSPPPDATPPLPQQGSPSTTREEAIKAAERAEDFLTCMEQKQKQ
ncbi:hypothetical protein ACA910_017896 [Epithemia clementina (nom. ined.)]